MSRKWEEKTKNNLIDVITEATGISIDRTQLLKGATEKDIVLAGIEEVMTQATKEVIEISLSRKVDLRTAAYINGIQKIHEFYLLSGIPGCEWFSIDYLILFEHMIKVQAETLIKKVNLGNLNTF